MTPDAKREMLRHTLATLAYRGRKAVDGAPDSFAALKISDTTRTPAQILAHIGDLLDWALSLAQGAETWRNSEPLPWTQEVARFHAALARFDEFLAGPGSLACTSERLFQGPVADALTHVGQIAMLRRVAGVAIRGENYSKADIVTGRLGPAQKPPPRESD
jgi:hypothetical protein